MKISIDKPRCIYEIGKRDNQEDALCPAMDATTSNDRVFVLCDGMGGHEQGEVASQIVSTVIYDYLTSHWPDDDRVGDNLILKAINVAYDALDIKDNELVKKMGTTLSLLVLHEGGCTAVHIGDSRIYHLRTAEQRFLYRSRDHSLVTDLYQAGEISFEEMITSPQKNIITKAMQSGIENRVKPDIVHIGDLRSGDYLFLCSDGMMEQMNDNQLIEILCAKESDDYKRRKLIDETAENSDNHSAYLIKICEAIMDEDEIVVNDEGTSRCNLLNILSLVVDVEEVDENMHEVEEEIYKNITIPSWRFKSKWHWLLLAAILLLTFWALGSMIHDNDRKKFLNQQEIIQLKPVR